MKSVHTTEMPPQYIRTRNNPARSYLKFIRTNNDSSREANTARVIVV